MYLYNVIYYIIYSSKALHVNGIHIYQQQTNIFERPPLVAEMQLSTGVRLILIGIHTQPRNVFNELDALSNVFQYACQRYGINSGFMIGDFNAAYLSQQALQSLSIFTDTNCHWLIHGVYTNVGRRVTSQRKLYDQ